MFFHRLMCIWIMISFLANSLCLQPNAYAQTVLNLPEPGTMVGLSAAYTPVLIKGLKIDPNNPLSLDFIVATGNDGVAISDRRYLENESRKLIKYFFAALTLPDKDVWVNLSPYEKDRIIPKATSETEMGRDMLAQDYILKQISASLIYPEKCIGQEFWNKVYAVAAERFGTTKIPVNTFNKVWIVADKASVYEAKDTVIVVDSHLKVMLEQDYLSLQKHKNSMSFPNASIGNLENGSPIKTFGDDKGVNSLGSQIVRQIVLPALEKEVNEGKNFANLRQIFHSLILAKWYKETLKTALLNQVYSNKAKITGLSYMNKNSLSSPNAFIGDPEHIYQQYLKAYKKGVFNYIKEDIDQTTKQRIPRKYFSGGVSSAMVIKILNHINRLAVASLFVGQLFSVDVTSHAQGLTDDKQITVPSTSVVLKTNIDIAQKQRSHWDELSSKAKKELVLLGLSALASFFWAGYQTLSVKGKRFGFGDKPNSLFDYAMVAPVVIEGEQEKKPLKKVLLIEDDAEALGKYRDNLQRRFPGAQITLAATLEKALERLQVNSYDAVISDFHLSPSILENDQNTAVAIAECISQLDVKPALFVVQTNNTDLEDISLRIKKHMPNAIILKKNLSNDVFLAPLGSLFEDATPLKEVDLPGGYKVRFINNDNEIKFRVWFNQAPSIRTEVTITSRNVFQQEFLRGEAIRFLGSDFSDHKSVDITLGDRIKNNRVKLHITKDQGHVYLKVKDVPDGYEIRLSSETPFEYVSYAMTAMTIPVQAKGVIKKVEIWSSNSGNMMKNFDVFIKDLISGLDDQSSQYLEDNLVKIKKAAANRMRFEAAYRDYQNQGQQRISLDRLAEYALDAERSGSIIGFGSLIESSTRLHAKAQKAHEAPLSGRRNNNLEAKSPWESRQHSSAMVHAVQTNSIRGGIDFNSLKIKMTRKGSGIQIQFNQAMIALFKRGDFSGIDPEITRIKPIANIYPWLGFKNSSGVF